MDGMKKLSISQVSRLVGYKPHVIRFYEKEFDLEIPRNKSGHRFFTYREVETLKYIKQLQDKGLTNGQIKVILKTPEVAVSGNSDIKEIAVTHTAPVKEEQTSRLLHELMQKLSDEIKEGLTGINDNIRDLADEIRARDKDILICENAKLKMDIKRKAYEVAELREQLKIERSRKKTLLGKLFYR